MFCASPVLLNLTVIKCRLGLSKWLLWPSFARPVLFVLSFVYWNVFYCCVLTAQAWLDFTWPDMTCVDHTQDAAQLLHYLFQNTWPKFINSGANGVVWQTIDLIRCFWTRLLRFDKSEHQQSPSFSNRTFLERQDSRQSIALEEMWDVLLALQASNLHWQEHFHTESTVTCRCHHYQWRRWNRR